jgi:hypothetical protein
MKRPLLTLLLLAVLLAQLSIGRVFSQADGRKSNRAESRLESKAKPHTTTVASKTGLFSFLRRFTKQTNTPKPAAPASTNSYHRSSTASQPSRFAGKTNPNEPVAQPTTVSAEQRGGEELAQQNDKLFSNERLTVSHLYPNPATEEYTTVDYAVSGPSNQAKLSFFNALGSPVGEYDLDRNERRLRIRTAEWPNGIYFYQLALDGRTLATKKLLVRHP